MTLLGLEREDEHEPELELRKGGKLSPRDSRFAQDLN